MRPKYSCGILQILQAKNYGTLQKLAFNYGAFGAIGPARAGQKTLRNFFKKVDFWGSRETLREPQSASYFRDPFWDPSNLDEAVRNEAG